MKFTFLHKDKEYMLTLSKDKDGYTADIGGSAFTITDVHNEHNVLIFTIKGTRFAVYHVRAGTQHHVNIAGEDYVLDQVVGGSYKGGIDARHKGNSVSSPMPGLIVKIPVVVGQKVEEGDVLAIVEAMKMQNELRAPRKGKVKDILFDEGQQIDALKPIVELEEEKDRE